MKPKTLVLMVVAVTCGLGASYMTSRLLAERSTDDAEKTPVLVARKQIDNGVAIKVPQDMFEEKLFVKGEEPRDALAKLDDLKGRVMKRTLRVGDFIRADDMLDSKDPQSTFSVNLPEGFRAMGLRVNLESIAGGFASLPHSRVDIVQTVRRGDDKTSYAQIILENVLVLAADAKTTRDEGGNAMPASIVTFALSPEDALKLSLCREGGSISLMLRKFGDNRHSPVEKVTAADVKMGTTGYKGGENTEDSTEAATGSTGAVAGISLPPLNPNDAKPAEAVKVEAPTGRPHSLTVMEGPNARVAAFLLDKDGKVMNQDVNRSEISARPPQVDARPPQVDRPEAKE
jgi:Flp pilus assembly protein CpaB